MCELNRKNLIPDFQAHVMAATTKEEILDASMSFISIHGGFSDSPEAYHKFKEQFQPSSL